MVKLMNIEDLKKKGYKLSEEIISVSKNFFLHSMLDNTKEVLAASSCFDTCSCGCGGTGN